MFTRVFRLFKDYFLPFGAIKYFFTVGILEKTPGFEGKMNSFGEERKISGSNRRFFAQRHLFLIEQFAFYL